MCKFNLNLLVGILILTSTSLFGQQQPYLLGKSTSFLQTFQHARASGRLNLPVSADRSLPALVSFQSSSGPDQEQLGGTIDQMPNSSFYLLIDNGSVNGHILLIKNKTAWRYYDSSGQVYVQETDINKLICIDLEKAKDPSVVAPQKATSMAVIPDLQSYPGGNGCILLDFDGEVVTGTLWNSFNGGAPINAAPATITDAQQLETFDLMSEDFKPFHLNITTSEAVFNTYPKTKRMRCIFTPTKEWYPASSGGVAYGGSFTWNDDSPCWVFNASGKSPGEIGSHEAGHTLGLSHDGRTNPAETYYYGHGNWAPIMGVGNYRDIVQWSKGQYTNANQFQDDLAIMASQGVGYRADDYGNDIASASALTIDAAGNVNQSGIIERTGDVDMFFFTMNNTTVAGDFTVTINPAARHPNLDIQARVHFSDGTVIITSNPSGLPANIYLSMTNGQYYLSVTGTGAGTSDSTGYSNYSSLGQYTITGTVIRAIPTTSTPASDVVTLYADTVYRGNAVNLAPGVYTTSQLAALGMSDDAVSSVTVKDGYELMAYQNDLFSGSPFYYSNNTPNLAAQDNSFSSVVVTVSSALSAASVFRDCNNLGYRVNLLPGAYTKRQLYALGIQDNDLSSLTVKDGYRVVLFNSDNFQGTNRTFATSASCFTANSFDNLTTSLRVEAITPGLRKAAQPIVTSVNITPNPATDHLVIQYKEPFDVTIFNANGVKVLSRSHLKNKQSINIAHLGTGIYFVTVNTGKEVVTKKITKN